MWRLSAFLTAATLAAAGLAVFRVETPGAAGFVLRNSPTPEKYLIETMGGGVALLDYDNDGILDVFYVNGGLVTPGMKPPENFQRSGPKYWNRLYRRNRDGSVTEVTEAAGLSRAGDGNYGMGVTAGDYDNDGYTDLYVTGYGRNVLYHNNGDGTFTDVTAKAGVASDGWSASAGFLDYDNDGRLDLFVTRYMQWDTAHSKACGAAYRTYCPPGEFPPVTNVLFHNRGDGTFEDVSVRSGIAAKKGRSLGVAFADYDGDGWTDIFVANDGMEQFLFHNNGNGTFTERAEEAGVALSDDGKPISGMGADFQDYDNDGRPDIVVTDLARQTYALYRNAGDGTFSYRSLQAGLGALTQGSSGWGVRLEDFDNDGWKDLFAAQGHVMDNVEKMDGELHYLERPLLALNRQGRFERANTGMNAAVAGRGAAFGDLNDDGWIDVAMTVLGGHPLTLMNRPVAGRHWLGVKLVGTRSNRDGFGARVRVNDQTRFATAAGSYLSSSDKRLHFGLGEARKAAVEVDWPGGARQRMETSSVDRYIEIRESVGGRP